MIKQIIENTDRFMNVVPKVKRKKYGQFFTNVTTAQYMASLLDLDITRSHISLLDAGAGTGILSAAVVQRLIDEGYAGHVHITCYETDPLVLPLLEENLKVVSNNANVSFNIINDNYITSQSFGKDTFFLESANLYDYVIGNPPYLKIPKDTAEAKAMSAVCHGAPNMYFLFWAMGIYNLKQEQQLVYIVPRSWTSGAYFKKFREYLFDNCVITDIHLFESRDKVFDGDSVLQETMIVKVSKTRQRPTTIRITTSAASDFSDVKSYAAPYDTVVGKNQYVYLVANEDDAETLKKISSFKKTLPDINLRMQTGIVVDFRTREVLRDRLEDGAYPLLYAQHIKDGRVVWPQGKEGECIKTQRESLLQVNSDLLLVKRFTSKEEERRLQCGIYLKQRYAQFEYISTQNKVNYIKCDSPCITYGLYVLLNSTLYDCYYRILNGSTQVNSTEINQMPIPERQIIEEMGRELMHRELSVINCNDILGKWIS